MGRFSKRLVAVAAMLAAAGAMAMTSGGPAAAAMMKKHVTIALFVAIQSNPVDQAIINDFHAVAKKDGHTKFVVFDSNNSVQKEIANCNDAITSKQFNAFALKAVAGPPLMHCAEKAMKAGIPVVVFGNALGPNPNTAKRQIKGLSASVIELSNVNGMSIAKLTHDACMAKHAHPCKVIYTYGPLAFDWASISRKYFEQTVKKDYPNIHIVAEGANNFDPNTARTLIKSLVQAHPNVDVVASDGDLGAIGVIEGLKDMGKKVGKGGILVTGGAFSKIGKKLMLKGEMFGSTCLLPTTEAETAAKDSIRAARHEHIAHPDVEVCALFSPTGNAPITMANVHKFTPQF
ncbi:MAG: sugar ABC transporter substrate-binding protein [Stellaceae bacterium]